MMIESLILVLMARKRRVKSGFFDDGFGDLVRKLVELLQVVVSATGATATTGGDGRLPRGLTAFIHIIHKHTKTRNRVVSFSL